MHDHPVIEIGLAIFTSTLALGALALAAWVLRDVIQYFPELYMIRFFI
jgi:hypothetical protein